MPASYVSALLLDYNWNGGAAGAPVTVTYNFDTLFVGSSVFDATLRNSMLTAMTKVSEVANVAFVPDSNPYTAKLTFSVAELGGNTIGLAQSWVSGHTSLYAEIVMDDDNAANYGYAANNYGYQTMLHELGHAMGLDHPEPYAGTEPAPHLPLGEDSQDNTVMSYNPGAYTYFGRSPSSFMPYDIAALQYLYGVNTSYNAGNTTYAIDGSLQARTLWDGGGSDTLSAMTATASVLDLREGMGHISTIGNSAIWIAYNATIENASAGSGNDTVYGSAVANLLLGNGGADLLYGDNANDTIHGGDGHDFAYGGAGADALYGNLGIDTMFGDDGNDTLFGGNTGVDNSTDLLIGNEGNDLAFGNEGDDFIYGNGGMDTLLGNIGNDLIYGDHGPVDITGDLADLLFGNEGSDSIYGGGGNDTLYGSGAEADMSGDLLIGNGGTDLAFGQDGNDYLYGNLGADTLLGGNGNDVLYGDQGPGDEAADSADLLFGDAGIDIIFGAGGDDTLIGGTAPFASGDGGDYLDAGGGNDVLYGASGSDLLLGGLGNDTLYGGADNDFFYFGNGFGQDMIVDFNSPGLMAGDMIQVQLHVNGTGIDSADDLLAFISYLGGNAIIDLGSGNNITLLDIALASLTPDDFTIIG